MARRSPGGASGPIKGDPGRRLLRIGVQRHLNADTGRLPISKLALFISLLRAFGGSATISVAHRLLYCQQSEGYVADD